MAGLTERFARGPITFQVFAAVAGGQLVAPGTAGNAGLVGPAAAGIGNCLGVATTDGMPVGTATTGTTVDGFPSLNTAVVDENVAVARHGVYKLLVAAAGFVLGDHVKTAANGTVQKWISGTDAPDLKIGQCVDPLGGVIGSGSLIDLSL